MANVFNGTCGIICHVQQFQNLNISTFASLMFDLISLKSIDCLLSFSLYVPYLLTLAIMSCHNSLLKAFSSNSASCSFTPASSSHSFKLDIQSTLLLPLLLLPSTFPVIAKFSRSPFLITRNIFKLILWFCCCWFLSGVLQINKVMYVWNVSWQFTKDATIMSLPNVLEHNQEIHSKQR